MDTCRQVCQGLSMLIVATNKCSAGCSHCLQSSTPAGVHMSEDTFLEALAMTERVESLAWAAGCPRVMVLSGGECTEHPLITRFCEHVLQRGMVVMLLSNGHFLGDKDLRESLLRPEWDRLFVQVTYDPRFYPHAPPVWEDKRIFPATMIPALLPLGRAKDAKKSLTGIPRKLAPSSFNLRSLARSLGSIEAAVAMLRTRSQQGLSGACIPAVSENGDITAGESRFCHVIGNVRSTNAQLTEGLLTMKCNTCGLVGNLSLAQQQAIGEA
jgi:hypothetical protein